MPLPINNIRNNPVLAELVGQQKDYLYSSMRDLRRRKGLNQMVMT